MVQQGCRHVCHLLLQVLILGLQLTDLHLRPGELMLEHHAVPDCGVQAPVG